MSQHDYILSNQTRTNFRADVNLALLAIVSGNSGATEPTVKYAYMVWVDMTAGKIKQRNAANDAWIIIGDLGQPYWGMVTAAAMIAADAVVAAAFAAADAAHVAAANPHSGYIKHALATVVNDFLVASGSGAFVKKTLAEVKTILEISSLTYAENFLTADVGLAVINTFYDGPTLTLAVGTWLVTGSVRVHSPSNNYHYITVKLWDGTTVMESQGFALYNDSSIFSFSSVVAGGATWKISAATNSVSGGAPHIAASPEAYNDDGCANTSAHLTAVKIA